MSAIISSQNFLAVQEICGVIVCKACQISIPSDKKAKVHLFEEHKLDKEAAKLLGDAAWEAAKHTFAKGHPLRQLYERAPYPIPGSTEPPQEYYEPLGGLKIYTGFKCTLCPACYSSEAGMRGHIDRDHSDHALSRDEQWQKCEENGLISLQTLGRGKSTQFFPVRATAPIGIVQTPPRRFVQQCRKDPVESDPEEVERITAARDRSAVPPDMVNGARDSYLLDVFDEMEEVLRPSLDGVQMTSRSKMNAFVARTKLDVQLRESNIAMEEAVNLSGHIGEHSEVEALAVRDVHVYLRRVEGFIPDIALSVLQDINLRGDKEFATVSSKSVERYARGFARLVICAIRSRHRDIIPEATKEPLDEYIRSRSSSSSNDEKRLELLHRLLRTMCLQHLEKVESPRKLFVRHFLMLATVTSSRSQSDLFRFVEASDLSPLLAALLYGTSCCAITEVFRLGKESPLGCAGGSSEQESVEKVLKAVDESENTAASLIRNLLSIANAVSRRDDVDFMFDICETHQLCGIVKNIHIRMSKLGEIVRKLHEEIDSEMSSLRFGSPLPAGFLNELSSIEDFIQEKSPGFSFLASGKNKRLSQRYALWLFRQMTEENPVGKAEFSVPEGFATSEVVSVFGKKVRRKAVEKWLAKVQGIQDKLLACSHISSGSPGRATELETLQLFNTEYALRNLYISQGRVLLVTRYSKIRSLAGWDRIIPRFPDGETSKRFLTYLLLLRTLETVFVRELYGKRTLKSHINGLFVERGTSYIACRIRDEIRRVFHSFGIPIEFNHFRHFAAGIVCELITVSSEVHRNELIEEAIAIAHLQAGHSPEVAEMNYARRSSDLPAIPTRALAKYRMFSTEWHRAMLLVPTSRSRPVPSSSLSAGDVSTLSSAIIASVSTQLSKVNDAVDALTRQSVNRNKRQEHPTPPTQPWRRPASRLMPPSPVDLEKELRSYLPSLRAFFKDDTSMFRSDIQLQVTKAVCEGREDMLVLMPTGAGKTLTVLLPSFLEEMRTSTVVFVPIAALVHEYVSKCKKHGISVATWANRSEDAQIYVFSTNHPVTELQSFLRSLLNKGKLRRLVIDEVHLLLIWLTFRGSFRRLPHALRAGGRYVQIILFTATLPPFQRDRLANLLYLPSLTLYHQPTTRKNLRYEVVEASVERNHGQFSTPEEAMTKVLCDKLLGCCRHLLQNGGGRIMVFALYKKEVERLKRVIEEMLENELNYHFPVHMFHGGMSSSEQETVFMYWKGTDLVLMIVVCTSAFGSGVDAWNVRAVFHFGGSNALPEYVQETGRNGRDGKEALCCLIYHKQYADEHRAKVFREKGNVSFSNGNEQEEKKQEWEQMEHYMTQTTQCRKNILFSYVDGSGPGMCIFDEGSVNCDICDPFTGPINFQEPNAALENSSPLAPAVTTSRLSPPSRIRGAQQSAQQVGSSNTDRRNPRRSFGSPADQFAVQLPNQPLEAEPVPPNGVLNVPTPPEVRRRLSFNSPSQGTDDTLNVFRAKVRRLQNICVACLVVEGKHEMREHRCKHMRDRCKRCFQKGHTVRSCQAFDPRRKNYCYGCGLSQIKGENVHKASEFGTNCFMSCVRDLAWMTWGNSEEDREKLATFFEDIEKEKYHEVRNGANNLSSFFDTWLRTEWDSVPNQVKFILSGSHSWQ